MHAPSTIMPDSMPCAIGCRQSVGNLPSWQEPSQQVEDSGTLDDTVLSAAVTDSACVGSSSMAVTTAFPSLTQPSGIISGRVGQVVCGEVLSESPSGPISAECSDSIRQLADLSSLQRPACRHTDESGEYWARMGRHKDEHAR